MSRGEASTAPSASSTPTSGVSDRQPCWRHLLTLDCLLADPEANWLATGAEKLQYFFDRGYDEEELPQRLLGDRAFHHTTLKPIAGGEDSVSFVFPDPGHGTNRALRYWASDQGAS